MEYKMSRIDLHILHTNVHLLVIFHVLTSRQYNIIRILVRIYILHIKIFFLLNRRTKNGYSSVAKLPA